MSKQVDNAAYRSDPKNARRHGDRNKAMIRASLEEVGPFRSIGIDGDNIVRAGNGVYEQAQALGLKVREIEAAPDELIAVKRSDLRGDAAIKAALWDNRTSETSDWDGPNLAEYAAMFNLSDMFDARELAERTGGFSIPEPPLQQEPTLVSACYVEIYCTRDDLVDFRGILAEWGSRKDVTINIQE